MHPDNLISLKDDMVAFIAGHGMRRLPGYIGEEVPTVTFEDESPDGWKDFVEHAKAAGAPFVTMSEVVLKKADLALLMEQLQTETFPPEIADELEDAQYLVNHVGKIGYLQLGFAHQGVMFMFETATEWYDNFQALLETVSDVSGLMMGDDYDGDE
jgi:maltose-binding protein MalE